MAYIYKITNTQNGKIYIGKTLNAVEKRFGEHCRDYLRERCEKRPLYAAMRKYGVDNFIVETIEETDNPDERERYWIEYYGSFKNGYNATTGGDGRSYIDVDLIISTYKKTQNIAETARILKYSRDSIKNILENNNIKIKPNQEIAKEK
jgi:group I intron endonuclease